MLTLQNFEDHVGKTILAKGEEYFESGYVSGLECIENGTWTAEVEGSETYMVEIGLKSKGKISHYECDCPYEGDLCKHVVAVLFALREEEQKEPYKKTGKKPAFETILQLLTIEECHHFIRKYAAKNRGFKLEFELFFADKNPNADVEEKYTRLLQQLVDKYSDHGFVHYAHSSALSKQINKLLETGIAYLAKNNFRDALGLGKATLKSLVQVIAACDDSNGNISDSIDNAIGLLHNIADSGNTAIDIREELFAFLQTELASKEYFNYGNFGYDLFSLFEKLSVQLNKPDVFLLFIDKTLAKLTGEYDDYQLEYFQNSKIEFLKLINRTGEAEKLVQQNLHIVSVRQGEVHKAITQNDFKKAKQLISEGIKIAEKQGHPGTVDEWRKQFLHIAVLENDIDKVRYYAKYFAFDGGFSRKYYNQWKATFGPEEWKKMLNEYIEAQTQKITDDWKKSKQYWRPDHPPLLQALGDIYIEENLLDKLLQLLQQENDLNTLLRYHAHLSKHYPAELIALYLPAVERFADSCAGRNEYRYLVKVMQKIIKDIPVEKEKVLGVAKMLKQKYSVKPRRPAMIEELDKIL